MYYMYIEFPFICHHVICQTFKSTTIPQYQYDVQVPMNIQLIRQTHLSTIFFGNELLRINEYSLYVLAFCLFSVITLDIKLNTFVEMEQLNDQQVRLIQDFKAKENEYLAKLDIAKVKRREEKEKKAEEKKLREVERKSREVYKRFVSILHVCVHLYIRIFVHMHICTYHKSEIFHVTKFSNVKYLWWKNSIKYFNTEKFPN